MAPTAKLSSEFFFRAPALNFGPNDSFTIDAWLKPESCRPWGNLQRARQVVPDLRVQSRVHFF